MQNIWAAIIKLKDVSTIKFEVLHTIDDIYVAKTARKYLETLKYSIVIM